MKHVEDILESSGQAYFKTVIGCPIWPRIHGENMGNVLLQTEQCRLYIVSSEKLIVYYYSNMCCSNTLNVFTII